MVQKDRNTIWNRQHSTQIGGASVKEWHIREMDVREKDNTQKIDTTVLMNDLFEKKNTRRKKTTKDRQNNLRTDYHKPA